MWLELCPAAGVLAEIFEQFLDRLSERLVLRIFVKLGSQELDLVNDTVSVAAVPFTQQISALIV